MKKPTMKKPTAKAVGRPRADDPRHFKVTTMLTSEEHAFIREMADTDTVSDYVRDLVRIKMKLKPVRKSIVSSVDN